MPSDRAPIGLLVEGQSDALALPILCATLGVRTNGPVIHRAGGFSKSPASVVVDRAIWPKLITVLHRGLKRAVIVVDLEDRPSAGTYCDDLTMQIALRCRAERDGDDLPPVEVVVADTCLENWIIADPESVCGHSHVGAFRARNNVDGIDAQEIIQKAMTCRYQKTLHAPALLGRVRPIDEVLQRSASLSSFIAAVTAP